MEAYGRKTLISSSDIQKFSSLWKGYQANDYGRMVRIGNDLSNDYPFLLPAIKAHGARGSVDGSPGRPEQAVINIINELQTTDFPQIFKEFSKREGIYGFGDVQVKRLLEKIIDKNTNGNEFPLNYLTD